MKKYYSIVMWADSDGEIFTSSVSAPSYEQASKDVKNLYKESKIQGWEHPKLIRAWAEGHTY